MAEAARPHGDAGDKEAEHDAEAHELEQRHDDARGDQEDQEFPARREIFHSAILTWVPNTVLFGSRDARANPYTLRSPAA